MTGDTTPSDEPGAAEGRSGQDADGSDGAALPRRDYLRSVAAAGAIGAVGTLAGPATGATLAQGEGWEAAADERIAEHRTGDLEVVVEDENGDPVSGAVVDVEMREHDYRFGTAVNAPFLVDGIVWDDDVNERVTEADQQRYRETIPELFNTVVLENVHKWHLWEDNQQLADEAVDWALGHGMDVRGHVCLWGNVGAWAVPPDVVSAMGTTWPNGPDGGVTDPDYDPEHVRQRSMDHIEEIIGHYGDDVTEWEVVNEVMHETAMIAAIEEGPDTELEPEDAVEAPILAEWYERAEEVADREGVGIAVNDYNTLEGAYETDQATYERQIEFLVEDTGIDLDGIGFQCHFDANETLTPDRILESLDRFADYGAGLRATEFDTFQEMQGVEWESPEEQGRYLYQFLKTFFSHPDTEAFVMWGHWDTIHWGPDMGEEADAPLYDDEWNEKPGYEYYTDLVFDQWWTEEEGETGSDGSFETTAFLGEHEVTVTVDGEATTETVSVTDPAGTAAVTVTVDDDGGDCADGIEVGDYCAQDATGDGLHEDVNGDGEPSQQDVAAFFEHLESDAVQGNSEAFNFDGEPGIGFDDIVALFRRV